MYFDMLVNVNWSFTSGMNGQLWQIRRGLYSYLHPRTQEVLYIGKVDGTSVRQRWIYTAKSGFWDDLKTIRKIREHIVIVGQLSLESSRRFSSELLEDVESLLINHLQPWGNIQSSLNRISRPGMVVTCTGTWPVSQTSFQDYS